MKKIGLCVISIVVWVFSANAATLDGIKWHAYDEGLKLGAETKKKIFVSFYADWCGYCKVMDKKTFRNADVIRYLNENFVSIKINSDKNRKIAREYGIKGLPSTWFLAEDGRKLDFRPGYIEPAPMLKWLKTVVKTDTSSTERVNWQAYREGREKAKTEDKKAFIMFVNGANPFCQILENNTFTDPKVVDYLNSNYISIRVDTKTQKKPASDFGVKQTPQMWFVNGNGERIGSQNGYVPSTEMLQLLMYIHTDSYLKMGMREFVKSL